MLIESSVTHINGPEPAGRPPASRYLPRQVNGQRLWRQRRNTNDEASSLTFLRETRFSVISVWDAVRWPAGLSEILGSGRFRHTHTHVLSLIRTLARKFGGEIYSSSCIWHSWISLQAKQQNVHINVNNVHGIVNLSTFKVLFVYDQIRGNSVYF